jgi:hypothetical protein
MSEDHFSSDPSTWDPTFDAVTAAPENHRFVLENERLRVLEVTLEAGDEEGLHHHRWPFRIRVRSDGGSGLRHCA